jgi:class 3 adenylate cyclase/tetratricopeptide (TPR) repeat protein
MDERRAHEGIPEKTPSSISMDGERRTVTILFADISGFTALSEKLDPESVRNIVNECFDRLVPIVRRYGGTVDKFIGDEIMALFGAPHAHENDPERAVRAALDMMEALRTFNVDRGTDLGIHMGINTGLVVAGGIGSTSRQEYSVMGDAVNLASRLADASERGQILAGPETHRLTCPLFDYEELNPINVKGKAEPVAVFLALKPKPNFSQPRGLASLGIHSPLVGRAVELAKAAACLDGVLSGEGGVLAIMGDAGIGKSRLVSELHDRATQTKAASSLLWLEGRPLSFDQTISYWSFQTVIWQWAGITEMDSEPRAWGKLERSVLALFGDATAELLPYVASLLKLDIDDRYADISRYLDAEALQRQIYMASRRFFEKLTQAHAVVLVFEDLHWQDESSLLLLEHLMPLAARLPLLFCVTSRTSCPATARRALQTARGQLSGRYAELNLMPLSPDASAQLMQNLMEIRGDSMSIRDRVLAKAQGNPFFLEETLRSLIHAGAVARDERSNLWVANARADSIAIPDTIKALITARVDMMQDELKRILRTASVIGNSFLYRVLEALENTDQQLDAHLGELLHKEFIREKQRAPELEYAFEHAAIQDATYESLLLEKKRQLHGQVAAAIERLFVDRIEEFFGLLAFHYARAESWDKAADFLSRAADQSGKLGADSEALALFEQTLNAYSRSEIAQKDIIRYAALERKMGEALRRQGKYTQAVEYQLRALGHLGKPFPTTEGALKRQIAREIIVQVLRRLFSKRQLMRGGFELAGPRAAIGEELLVYEESFFSFLQVSPLGGVLAALRAMNISERNGILEAAAASFAGFGWLLDLAARSDLAERYFQKASRLAHDVQDPGIRGLVQLFHGIHASLRCNWQQATEYLSLAKAEFRCAAFWDISGWATAEISLSHVDMNRGDFEKSLQRCEEVYRVGTESGDRQSTRDAMLYKGFVLWRMGRLDEAITTLRNVMEIAQKNHDYTTYVMSASDLGWCHLLKDEQTTAEAIFAECLKVSGEHNLMKSPQRTRSIFGMMLVHLHSAEECRRAGKSEAPDLRQAKKLRRSVRGAGHLWKAGLPEALRLVATYHWLKGRRGAARRLWKQSLSMAEKLGVRFALAETHLEIGSRLSDPAHIEKAASIFSEIGAEWGLSMARESLAACKEESKR